MQQLPSACDAVYALLEVRYISAVGYNVSPRSGAPAGQAGQRQIPSHMFSDSMIAEESLLFTIQPGKHRAVMLN